MRSSVRRVLRRRFHGVWREIASMSLCFKRDVRNLMRIVVGR